MMDEKVSLLPSRDIMIKNRSCLHPTRRVYAYTVLFFVSVISLSGFFIYDDIGVVQQKLQDALGINAQQFGILYSIYSVPNCILPFFGGMLQDKLGVNLVVFVCCCLVALGSILVAAAPVLASGTAAYGIMLVGRLFFGLGAETTYVAQNALIVEWFKDKEMALAMALSISAGRLGTMFTLNVVPPAVIATGTWEISLYLGAAFGVFELICIILYIMMDKYAARVAANERTKYFLINNDDSVKVTSSTGDIITAAPSALDILYQVKAFPIAFWLFNFACTLFYMAIFPFQSTAVTLLQIRYGYSPVIAGRVVSLIPLITLILTPFCGVLVDKIGHRIHLVVLCLAGMVGANFIMIFTSLNPTIAVVIIGVMFSFIPAAIWPCLPLFIEEKALSTAFGLVSSTNNLGMFIAYYVQGWVADAFSSVVYQLLFYNALLILSTLLCIVWLFIDYRRGNICAKRG